MKHQSCAEDLPMCVEIESFRLQYVSDAADGVRVQQDSTQHSFFGLQVLGWNRIRQGLEIRLLVATPSCDATASPIVVLRQGDAHHGGRALKTGLSLWLVRAVSLGISS